MKKVLVSFILFLFILGSFMQADRTVLAASKIHVSAEAGGSFVNVIIELTDKPVIEYRKSLLCSFLSLVVKDASKVYEESLLKRQAAIVEEIRALKGTAGFSYTETFSGLSARIPADQLTTVANLPHVKSVFADKEAVLLRAYASKTIHSDEVSLLKDPLGNYIKGNNIVVGIIDTGVDYTHSELGGGSFPNSKVIGGYDFADNDGDPMDEEGHGTHVAGIVAGSKSGIAPEAKIRAYKIFRKSETTTSTSLIVKGIDQAVKDKVNVINISIGTVGGKALDSDPQSVSVRNAINAGVVVVAAAGNKGMRSEEIEFPISSPSSVAESISVGASDDGLTGVLTVYQREIYGQYPAEAPLFTQGNYELVYCGIGEKSDFQGKDLKGKIALIERGKIYFGDKNLNAKSAGAVGVIVYNNVSGMPKVQLVSQTDPSRKDFIPFLFVSYSDGLVLRGAVGKSISLSNRYGLGLISDFTSCGPTSDFYLKPDLLAPGTEIESAYLKNSTIRLSGTSMSSPVVAGAVALLMQAKPNLKPGEIKAILMNTADVLVNPVSQKSYAPYLQGAGRINLASAMSTNVFSTTNAMIFGNGELSKTFEVGIRNLSSVNKTLSVSVSFASFDTLSVSVSSYVSVAANGTASLSIKLQADSTIIESYGYVYLRDYNTNIHIPFLYLKNTDPRDEIYDVKLDRNSVSADGSINLSFSIGRGVVVSEDDSSFIGTLAEEVRVSILDSRGNIVKVVFDKAPIFVGNYVVSINSRAESTDCYYLKDGTYYFKVEYILVNENDYSKDVFKTVVAKSASCEFGVSGSPIEGVFLSMKDNYAPRVLPGTSFTLLIDARGINTARAFSIGLYFDPLKLSVQNVTIEDSLSSAQVVYSVDGGKIEAKISVSNPLRNFSGSMLRIRFSALEEGVVFIEPELTGAENSKVLCEPINVYVSKYSQRADINGDKMVNMADITFLRDNFGRQVSESDPLSKADLNLDGVIDYFDFFYIAKYYGEKYP